MEQDRILERWIHYIWSTRLYHSIEFLPHELIPTHTVPEIVDVGRLNVDAGPDFFCVQIRIGNILWVGNAEIHVKLSDWTRHKHHQDAAYNNVVLHVVLMEDASALPFTPAQKPITALLGVDSEAIKLAQMQTENNEASMVEVSHEIFRSKDWIPKLDELYRKRLEEQCARIEEIYWHNEQDIATTIHILLMRYLGGRVNNDAMERVAARLSPQILRKHTSSLFQLEALFLGQAGLLPSGDTDTIDSYAQSLLQEYLFLQHKYGLTSLPVETWRLLRMRPASFPHRRLALMAALYYAEPNLPAHILSCHRVEELLQLLRVELSPYWQTHYRFGSETKKTLRTLSPDTINSLAINVLFPIRLFYRRLRNEAVHEDWQRCYTLPPENNKIVRFFAQKGLKVNNAAHSQALLLLYKEWDRFSYPLSEGSAHDSTE